MRRPVDWAKFRGLKLEPYQSEVFHGLSSQAPIVRLTYRGTRGSGKTFLDSSIFWWFVDTSEHVAMDWFVFTTAPVFSQLSDTLWPAIHNLNNDLGLGYELLDMKFKGVHGLATSKTSRPGRASNIEGPHADRILVIIDEAKGIDPNVLDSVQGFLSQADTVDETGRRRQDYIVMSSAPGFKRGVFFDAHTTSKLWAKYHFTLNDCLTAGRVSQSWVNDMAAEYGEGSVIYRRDVLGEFCDDDGNQFLPASSMEKSIARYHELQTDPAAWETITQGPLIIGIDPASVGGDETAVAFYNPDYKIMWNQTTEKTTDDLVELGTKYATRWPDAEIIVDSDGLGEGVYHAARSHNRAGTVHGFKANYSTDSTSRTGSRFRNVKTQAWNQLKEMLTPRGDEPVLALPPDNMLWDEIQSQQIRSHTNDVLQAGTKTEQKAVLNRSPDRADSLIMCLWDKNHRKMKKRTHTLSVYNDFYDNNGIDPHKVIY